jgi:hypothetical protein
MALLAGDLPGGLRCVRHGSAKRTVLFSFYFSRVSFTGVGVCRSRELEKKKKNHGAMEARSVKRKYKQNNREVSLNANLQSVLGGRV